MGRDAKVSAPTRATGPAARASGMSSLAGPGGPFGEGGQGGAPRQGEQGGPAPADPSQGRPPLDGEGEPEHRGEGPGGCLEVVPIRFRGRLADLLVRATALPPHERERQGAPPEDAIDR